MIMQSQSQSNLQRKKSRWTRWRYMFWDSVTRLRKTVWVFIWRNSVKAKWSTCTWGATTTQWLFLMPNRVIMRFFSLFSQRLSRSLWYLEKKHNNDILMLYKSRGNFFSGLIWIAFVSDYILLVFAGLAHKMYPRNFWIFAISSTWGFGNIPFNIRRMPVVGFIDFC